MVLLKPILISLMAHLSLLFIMSLEEVKKEKKVVQPVKVTIKYEKPKEIVKTPVKETKPPKKSDFIADKNHATKKQTKPKPAPKKLKPKKKSVNGYGDLIPKPRDFNRHDDKIMTDVDEGEVLDLNTREYKYISYFIHLKRNIEQSWVHPHNRVKGSAIIRFTINADGSLKRARIIQSSGNEILDNAMLQTIKNSSPFNPIPKAWNRKTVTINGRFTQL